MAEHDVIVIGAGPAGEVCAGRLAGEGLDVALVERELVGGECAYWACMPSKALLRPAELLAEVRRIPGAGQAVTGALDPATVLARRDEVIHDLDDAGQLPWVRDRGITLYRAHARLAGERRVRVGDEVHEARRAVVIAVGSGAAIPPVPGPRGRSPRGPTARPRPPRPSPAVSPSWAAAPSAASWPRRGRRWAPRSPWSRPAGAAARRGAVRGRGAGRGAGDRGVDLGWARRPPEPRASDAGEFTLTLADGDAIASDELLVAVGRTPHTDGPRPGDRRPRAGRDDRGRRPHARPGRDWLYAIGDVNGRALLTQAGKYQAVVATANIMNREATAVWDGELSPRVVFTDPQIAAVGQTLREALDAGIPARAVDAEMDATPGASFIGKGAPSAVPDRG